MAAVYADVSPMKSADGLPLSGSLLLLSSPRGTRGGRRRIPESRQAEVASLSSEISTTSNSATCSRRGLKMMASLDVAPAPPSLFFSSPFRSLPEQTFVIRGEEA